jgi:hypothetical protein
MKKLMMLAAGAVGYVLGTRAGRERYEQIKNTAMKVKNDPRVQQKAREAGTAVKENAPVVKDKVSEAASHAKTAAQEKMGSGSDADNNTYPASGTPTPYAQS